MIAKLNRRAFLGLGVAALIGWSGAAAYAGPANMSAKEAYAAAKSGDLLLIDVRTRDEWKKSGIGEYAHAVSMHEKGFVQQLNALMKNDPTRKVAFICATGARSAYVQGVLAKHGYTNVISVGEGMFGSKYGKGWVKQGLPVKPFK